MSRRPGSGAVVPLAIAAIAGGAGCSPPSQPIDLPKERLVLVTIDTLRADHLPIYGYPVDTAPFLGGLAADGVVFDGAFAHSATTRPSHVSMLTSLYPLQHRVQDNHDVLDDAFVTVPEALRDVGYATAAFVSSVALSAESNLEQGLDVWNGPPGDPDDGEKNPYRRADATTDAVLAWLGGVGPGDRFFLWVHYYDPHKPLAPPRRHRAAVEPSDPESRERLAEFLRREHRSDLSRRRILDQIIAYDGEIRFVDAELRRLYEGFAARGLGGGSLWIVTSDHGQGLGNHGWFGHHKHIYNVQIRAPLVLHAPGRRVASAARIADLVEHVDLATTLLELAGASLDGQPAELQGRSLVPLLEGREGHRHRRWAFSERRHSSRVTKPSQEAGERYALQDAKLKYLWFSEGPDELYDLELDPYETTDLIAEGRAEGVAMKRTIERMVESLRASGEAAQVGDETAAKLRSLGYVD